MIPLGKGQMAIGIGRRRLMSALGGAAVGWPLVARAQPPALPVVGVLSPGTPETDTRNMAEFRKGLSEAGYVDGQNVNVDYRWLEGHYDRLPALLADLVHKQVTIIATPGFQAAA